MQPLRFARYEAADGPNVVVDGSPNPTSVLTISHWPGLPSTPDLWADTSAEMVLRYLDLGGDRHGDAEVVTNNHFDQDGLAGVFAPVDPAAALERRTLLADLARSGDFATYRDRRAARASMAIAALTDPERSTLGSSAFAGDYPELCAALYVEALGLLTELLAHPDRFRHLWKDEDDELGAAEAAIAAGRVDVREVTDIDLAVVRVEPGVSSRGGHRFASHHADGVHPMALHAATACVRLLLAQGDRYSYTDRYETWVQYRTRALPRRIDLGPVAEELSALEADATWVATGPGVLTPQLRVADDRSSSLAVDDVAAVVERALRTSPPAWDPYSEAPG
jgi:Family of unknown function (DUF6687)